MKRRGKKVKASQKQPEKEASENGTVSSSDDPEPSDKRRKIASTPKEKKSVPKKSKSPVRSEIDEEEDDEKDQTQYEVEKILDQKHINGVRHFLIRWKGYEPESDTWEPASTLNCPELITEFNKKQKKIKGDDKPKKKKKRASGNNEADDDDTNWDENEKFEVDRILDVYFRKNGKREFLVSWKGYPTSQNTWEPEENMDCQELIEKFMKKVEKARTVEHRELRVNRAPTEHFTLSAQSRERRLSKRHVGKQRVHYHDAE